MRNRNVMGSVPARFKRLNFASVFRGVILIFAAVILSVFLKGAEYLALILLAAAIHESGHIITAKLLKIPLVRAKGSLFGIWLKYDFSSCSYLSQIIVSCAGAAFNVIACIVTLLLVSSHSYVSVFFVFSNLALALFNLMPVSHFDGAGVLKCFCLMLTDDVLKVERICQGVFMFFSGAFFLLTVYIQMRAGTSLPMLCLSVFLLGNCFFGRQRT